jgi:hypothetical protein
MTPTNEAFATTTDAAGVGRALRAEVLLWYARWQETLAICP